MLGTGLGQIYPFLTKKQIVKNSLFSNPNSGSTKPKVSINMRFSVPFWAFLQTCFFLLYTLTVLLFFTIEKGANPYRSEQKGTLVLKIWNNQYIFTPKTGKNSSIRDKTLQVDDISVRKLGTPILIPQPEIFLQPLSYIFTVLFIKAWCLQLLTCLSK